MRKSRYRAQPVISWLPFLAPGLLALAACRPTPTPVPATPTGLPAPQKGACWVIAPPNFQDHPFAQAIFAVLEEP